LKARNGQLIVGALAAAGAAITVGRAAARRMRQRSNGASEPGAPSRVTVRALAHTAQEPSDGVTHVPSRATVQGPSREGPSRAYRLKRKEDVADGIRRMALGRADSAIDNLLGQATPDPEAAIHEARKDLKKLRSLLRLARGALGEESYRAENVRFRDAGRLLSGIRDAQVRHQTLLSLSEHYHGELDERTKAALTQALSAEAADSDSREGDDPRARASIEVVAGRAAIERWGLDGSGWDVIEDGLARIYARGRARLDDVVANPSDQNVHEWRKRVKDLWYHLRIIVRVWPEVMEGVADQAHELSDLLGDHHDLTVLRDHVGLRVVHDQVTPGGDGVGVEDFRRLSNLVMRRQDELLARSIPLGRRLYAEKPNAFCKRMAGYWRA
jgi:CHAD domain-containing protein